MFSSTSKENIVLGISYKDLIIGGFDTDDKPWHYSYLKNPDPKSFEFDFRTHLADPIYE